MLNEILIAIIYSLFFYILGCIPTSYLLGKNLFKIDILDKDSCTGPPAIFQDKGNADVTWIKNEEKIISKSKFIFEPG